MLYSIDNSAAWASAWLHGAVPFGSWFDWTMHWAEEHDRWPAKVHWIYYESLHSDPIGEITRLAAFLGLPADKDEVDGLLQRTARLSRMESMKEQAEKSGGDLLGHLRKGETGDWRGHFTDAEGELLVETCKELFREKLAGTGLSYSLGGGEYLVAP